MQPGFSVYILVLSPIVTLSASGRCKKGWSEPRLYDEASPTPEKRVARGREFRWLKLGQSAVTTLEPALSCAVNSDETGSGIVKLLRLSGSNY